MESEVRNCNINSMTTNLAAVKHKNHDQLDCGAVTTKIRRNVNKRVERLLDNGPSLADISLIASESLQKHEQNATNLNVENLPDNEYALNSGNIKQKLQFLSRFNVNIDLDPMAVALLLVAFCTRIYRLAEPNNIVSDELHYGKHVSQYLQRSFFFDRHPPLGKLLVAGVAHLAGYRGNSNFTCIGNDYEPTVPIGWLRFLPAFCGSLLSPSVYILLVQVNLNRWTAALGGVLIIFDNALLTQSRFILMESMLLTCSTLALLFLLRFHRCRNFGVAWFTYGLLSAVCFTMAVSVKFVGIYSCCLGAVTIGRYLWQQLSDRSVPYKRLVVQMVTHCLLFGVIPIVLYIGVFYVHLGVLYKAGTHDSIMTSAFQASLEGKFSSFIREQPLNVMHGSQITLRHTFGRTCWLHSHDQVYPVRYNKMRKSSRQQQVTCYSYKEVGNWWVVKKLNKTDFDIGDEPYAVRHGDEVQLVHQITGRLLNSHKVAAAMASKCREVTCYIDRHSSMPAQTMWRVDIINRDQDKPVWQAIKSQIRLIHVATGSALRFSGRQLPEWGLKQYEIATDSKIKQPDTVWNVEEHHYSKNQQERERQIANAKTFPTSTIELTFWQKFIELQTKMLWHTDPVECPRHSSDPIEWPMMSKGIAYWVDKASNAQIHLIGNIIIWYSGTAAVLIYCALLVFYLLRRRRLCFDLLPNEWTKFQQAGQLFLVGYLLHFLPYFSAERTLFLHNYLPALLFKVLLLCFVIEHLAIVLDRIVGSTVLLAVYKTAIVCWLGAIVWVFQQFVVFSYGTTRLTADDIDGLRWRDTWDFMMHDHLRTNLSIG